MPCYARACGLTLPCPTIVDCEKVWHRCDLPPNPALNSRYYCTICLAVWTCRTKAGWRRRPLIPWRC